MKARYFKYILAVLMLSAGSTTQAQTDNEELNKQLKFLYDNMVYVEGGTYLKGEAQVSTTVESFYCCRYETVSGLYYRVMGNEPEEDDLFPMIGPNWTQVQEFITKLNALTGKHYRLLTDDEWEYAARGGNKSKGYLYAGSNNIDEVAWYKGTFANEYYQVGSKLPNELGLYDMSGSAEEWCQNTAPTENSVRRKEPIVDVDWDLPEPPDFGAHKYVRGGSFLSEADKCTVYSYYTQPSDWGMPTIGSRLALDVSDYDAPKTPKFRIGLNSADANSEIDHEADYISYNPETQKFILPSTDEPGSEVSTELDIAQVDYISRAPVSNLKLPQGINTKNIELLGDDESIEIGEDGSFVSDAGTLIAYNNENLMYMNISPGRFEGQEVALNGIETAASMLAMLFPDAYLNMSLKNFTLFKLALAQLEETKALGDAIDNAVTTKGYFELSDIQKEYDAVLARLLQPDNTAKNSPRKAPREPSFYLWNDPNYPPQRGSKGYGDGYRVELNKSTWLPEGTDKVKSPVWQCDFTVYNLRRYCYLFVMKGKTADDGLSYPTSSDFSDLLRYVVKPQGVSTFMDFGSVSDIAEMKFLTKPIDTFKDADLSKVIQIFKEMVPLWHSIIKGEPYDSEWDTVKKSGIELDFEEGEDQLLVLGPHDTPLMKLYNFYMKLVLPVIKIYNGIQKLDEDGIFEEGEDAKADEDKDHTNIFVEYIKDLEYSDPTFYLELQRNLADGVSMKEFALDLGEKFWDSVVDFLIKKADKAMAKYTMKKKTAKFLEKLSGKAVQEITNMFKIVNLMFDGCDLILGALDWDYSGAAFNMQFDFNEPQGGIDPIPGEDL